MDLNKKIDLHMHSVYSDGTKTPAELVKIAKGAGLFSISLTDHDCIDGLSELKNTAVSNGIEIIEGVELSLKYKCTLHMLAYFPNGGISKMQPFFDKLKKERSERNPKILDALNRLGYNISFDDVLAEAGDSHVIGRLHFAKALISRNYVKSINEAFDLLLGENKPAYFEKENISPKDAIKYIRSLGGIPVLAHPVIMKIFPYEIEACISELKSYGLMGIEAYYTENSEADTQILLNIANQYGLLITGGSDFHGENKPGIDMGIGRGNLIVPYTCVEKIKSLGNKII